MPLLMGCTMPQAIEVEPMEEKNIYDPMTQKVVMNMRTIGTRSLKAAADDGTLLVMATRKSSSKDFSAAYNKFVHTSGFDSKKISEVLPTVALA